MILLIGGIKGGSGKTTIATHLAILSAAQKKDVLLIDADDQETASDFTLLRHDRLNGETGYTSIKLTGSAVRNEGTRLKRKYDDIIIDTGGRDTTSQRAAISIADIVLIPFVPRSFDIWTIEKITTLIEEMREVNPRLKAYSFLNRADSKGNDNKDAESILRKNETIPFLETPIGSRKAFSNAAAQGLSVTEIKPQDEKASNEILTLFRNIFNVK
ncbi:MAG: AAA family ATPase [Blastocatellia bacterium]|nr:AAA family ATPase [Blastocatellia bacterium]